MRCRHFAKPITFLLLSACSLKPQSDQPQEVTIILQDSNEKSTQSLSAPSSVSDLDCVSVVAMAPDIPNTMENGFVPDFDKLYSGDTCESYVGVVAPLVKLQSGVQLSIKVPSGSRRLFRVFGFKSYDGSCYGTQGLDGLDPNAGSNSDIHDYYEAGYKLGDVITDVFRSTTLSIKSSYDSDSAVDVLNDCNQSSGSDGTVTEEVELSLVQAWSEGGAYTDWDQAYTFPPATGSQITGGGLTGIASDGSTVFSFNSNTSQGAGYTLVFDLAGLDLADYTDLELTTDVSAGTTYGSCSTNPSSYNSGTEGVEARFLETDSGNAWSPESSASYSISIPGDAFSLSAASSGTDGLSRFEYSGSSIAGGTGPYIIVALRATDMISSNECSWAAIKNTHLYLRR